MEEIARLKKRVSALIIALTGAILLFTCLVTCRFSLERVSQSHAELFNSLFSSYTLSLQSRNAVDIVETLRFEQEHGLIIRLYENGKAVESAIPLDDGVRREIIRLAEEQFSSAGKFNDVLGMLNVKSGELGEWAGEYQIVPVGPGWYGVLMLQTQKYRNADIRDTVRLYCGLFLAGLVCLLAISRILSTVATKPLRQAYRRQMEFTAAAGHDLRTPAAIIKSSAQIILQEPETAAANAEKVVRECDRLARLLDEMLALSAGEAGILEIDVGEVDIEIGLITLYEQFTPLASRRGVALDIRFPDGVMPKVWGDEKRIYQILAAFVENALEYGRAGGGAAIEPHIGRRHVLVKVIDHGPGIPNEEKRLIFSRFHRADKSRTGREHFGLGLSIAQNLAQAQHADVWAEDTPGGGATFVLKLRKV